MRCTISRYRAGSSRNIFLREDLDLCCSLAIHSAVLRGIVLTWNRVLWRGVQGEGDGSPGDIPPVFRAFSAILLTSWNTPLSVCSPDIPGSTDTAPAASASKSPSATPRDTPPCPVHSTRVERFPAGQESFPAGSPVCLPQPAPGPARAVGSRMPCSGPFPNLSWDRVPAVPFHQILAYLLRLPVGPAPLITHMSKNISR